MEINMDKNKYYRLEIFQIFQEVQRTKILHNNMLSINTITYKNYFLIV